MDRHYPTWGRQQVGISNSLSNFINLYPGFRFVLAATEHLRNNLQKLESRMGCLEDALAIVHNSESATPHPLLRPWRDTDDDETPMIKLPLLGESLQLDNCAQENLGTVVVDDLGGSHFFGPCAGSEVCSFLSISFTFSNVHIPFKSILLVRNPATKIP